MKKLVVFTVLVAAACSPAPSLVVPPPVIVSVVPHVDTGGWSDRYDWSVRVSVDDSCPLVQIIDPASGAALSSADMNRRPEPSVNVLPSPSGVIEAVCVDAAGARVSAGAPYVLPVA